MVLVISFDVDTPIDQECELNEKQKKLLREFEEASDAPMNGALWSTTSEETYDKMMTV